MRPLLLCVWLVACEQMEPSGDPLAPVGPAAAPAAAPSAPAAPAEGPEDVTFRISSEELQAAATAIEEGASPNDALAEAQGDGAPEAQEESKPEIQPEIQPVMTIAEPRAVLPDAAGGWPIRLVVTMPSTQPPRAVIGLPDGREMVVTAGDLIPDVGMVVMSVGATSVQMAQVTAAGDHAQIANITLNAMY